LNLPNEKYFYLLLDFFSILLPFVFSFRRKHNFYNQWKFLWPAIVLPAALFILWDSWFTRMGIWGFNPRFILGIYVDRLPLEEIFFFICIPYACVFTYVSLKLISTERIIGTRLHHVITDVLTAGLLLVGLFNFNRWYPFVTFLSLALLLILLRWVWKADFLGKFYYTFIFILIPFFVINGILTGTGISQPVVWYKDQETLGIRMGTIPIEDIFYGGLLMLMNVSLFEYLQNKRPRTG
jgi:lycopene cyclase domain-containing protein